MGPDTECWSIIDMSKTIKIFDNTGLLEIADYEQGSTSTSTDSNLCDVKWDTQDKVFRYRYDSLWYSVPNQILYLNWNRRGREIIEWIEKQQQQQALWRTQAAENPAVADALSSMADSLSQLITIVSLAVGTGDTE